MLTMVFPLRALQGLSECQGREYIRFTAAETEREEKMKAVLNEDDGRRVYRKETGNRETLRLVFLSFITGFVAAYVLLHIFMF